MVDREVDDPNVAHDRVDVLAQRARIFPRVFLRGYVLGVKPVQLAARPLTGERFKGEVRARAVVDHHLASDHFVSGAQDVLKLPSITRGRAL